jgi:hypothetical protein
MHHLRSEKPISPQEWREFVGNVGPDTTFHDHATAFESPSRFLPKLRAILGDFAAPALAACSPSDMGS